MTDLASSLLDRMSQALRDVSDLRDKGARMQSYTDSGVDFRGVSLVEMDMADSMALSTELFRRLDGS